MIGFEKLFDYNKYSIVHEDLKHMRDNKKKCWDHFQRYGWKENRVNCFTEEEILEKYIQFKKSGDSIFNIPKIIHQTYKSYELPKCLLNSQKKLIEQNKNYKYKLYNDDDCRKILYDNFGFKAKLVFDMLKPGAFKADYFRYAILYLEGGVYIDMDLDFQVKLDYLFKNNTYDLITVNEKTSKYFDNKNIKIKGVNGYWNAFIAAKPKIDIFLRCVHKIIDNTINKLWRKAESVKDYNTILSITACVFFKEMFQNFKNKKLLFFPETKNNEIHDENNVCIIVDNHSEDYNKVRIGYEEMYFENNIYNTILCSLRKKYLNKDCVILTCGKSLKEYESHFVKQFCKNKTVICIKEAIYEYEDICDIFVANEGRFRNYGLKRYKYLKILQKGNKNYKNITDLYDLYMDEETPHNMNTNDNRLLFKKNFNDYIFDNNLKRPWGPGIMYETVFYLCEYMGFSNVYTLGWDLISQSDNNISHYFEDYNDDYYKKSMRYNVRSNDFEYDKFYEGKEFKSEMKLVNDNLPFLYNFFKSKNMHINVLGNQSYVNKIIPRKNLEINIIQFLNQHLEILPGFIEYFQSKSIVVNLYIGTGKISKIMADFKWVEFLKDHYNINVKKITDLCNDTNYSEFSNSLLSIFNSWSDIDYLYNHDKKIFNLYNKIIQKNNVFIVGHEPAEVLKIKNKNIKSIAITPLLKPDYIINSYGKIKNNSKEFNKNEINIACIGRCYKGFRNIDDILYVLEKYPNINIYMFTRINKIDDKFLEINEKFKNFKLLIDINTYELYKILESKIHFITPFVDVNNTYYETSLSGCFQEAINCQIPLIINKESNNVYKFYSNKYNFMYKKSLKETIEIISKISNNEYRVLIEEVKKFYTKKSNENIEGFKLLI